MNSAFVNIAGTDALPLFRSDGANLDKVCIQRIREPRESEWRWVSEPADGIAITAPEVLITRVEVQRFESEHDPLGSETRADGQEAGRIAHYRGPGPGVAPRYDWDTFYGVLARRIHDNGLPSTQAELVREMLDWFQARREDHAPDESTVRRKIAVVWREFNHAD